MGKVKETAFYIDFYGDLSEADLWTQRHGDMLHIYTEESTHFLRRIHLHGPELRSRGGSSTYRLTDGCSWTYIFPAGITPSLLGSRLHMEQEVRKKLRKDVKNLSDEIVRQIAGLLYGRYRLLPEESDALTLGEYCIEEAVPNEAGRKTWLSEIRKVKDFSFYKNQTIAVLYKLLG